MGIDVYLEWEEMSGEEHERQLTGFSIAHGHVGYLREAYHGGPYATRVLYPEGWADTPPQWTQAAILRERLPAAIAAAKARSLIVYGEHADDDAPEVRSLRDFVALAEQKEREGKRIRVVVSY